MKTLVLGSGITALAYLYYDREAFALAGDQPGGLFKQQVMGPQYVWATDSTKRFMKELGLAPKIRQLRIGYCLGGKLFPAAVFTEDRLDDIRRQYSEKTRGIAPVGSHMSSGKSNPEVFTIGVSHLVDVLFSKLVMRINKSSATNIDMFNQAVCVQAGQAQGIVEYDKLVSTIPAPTLMKLTGNEEQVQFLKAFDKAYRVETGLTPNHILQSGFDYVYFPEDEDFHRVSVVGGSGPEAKAICEYTMKPGGFEVPVGAKVHKMGQIIGGHEVLEGLPPSVECLGRYAEWRHDRRLENVLDVVS